MHRKLRSYNPETKYWYYLLYHGETVVHAGINQRSKERFTWSTSLWRPGVWGKRWTSAEYARAAQPYEMRNDRGAASLDNALAEIEERLRHLEASVDRDSP